MFFLARYCKLLEDTSFRGRTADFFFMLLFGGTILTIIVVGGGLLMFAAPFADILFLSNSLTFMMVRVLNLQVSILNFIFGLFFKIPFPQNTLQHSCLGGSIKLNWLSIE